MTGCLSRLVPQLHESRPFSPARRARGSLLRGRAGSRARAGRGAGAGARVRAESSRRLGARRVAATCGFRCRTSPAATSRAKSCVGRRRRAGGAACDAAAGDQLRPLHRLSLRGATTSARATRCSATANHPGGYAEYVKVPVQNLIAIPDEIDFVHAAAFPLTFVTAWHMLMTRARLERGEDVLVLAAGSGVGQAAIQIACLHGARVFATAGTRGQAGTRPRARRGRGHRPPPAGHRRGNQAADEQAGRRCRHRTCRRSDLAEEPAFAGPRRAPRHLRRDDRRQRAINIDALFCEAVVDAGVVHGNERRAAARRALLFRRSAEAGRRSHVPARRRRRRAPAAGSVGTVREDRARSAMSASARRASACSALIAVVSIVLAAATVWLFRHQSGHGRDRGQRRRHLAAGRAASPTCSFTRSADCSNISERRTQPQRRTIQRLYVQFASAPASGTASGSSRRRT